MAGQKNLTMAAYDSIKQMMLHYDIVPGQRLIFVDLAKQLGVSRTPVNNALSILAKEGYLDFVPNQGYTVHKLTIEEAVSLYEIKEILEAGAIGKAIRKISPEKLALLESKKIEYEKSISGCVLRKLFILDADYHACTIEMIENHYLVNRYKDICQRIFLRFNTGDHKLRRFVLKNIPSCMSFSRLVRYAKGTNTLSMQTDQQNFGAP
ncbi:MAG: GntR family transcriptional regulator [Desulfobacteraceae bacterium]|nr:GntR family transcriptional regulator [Desulfobacteraceae bacterium]